MCVYVRVFLCVHVVVCALHVGSVYICELCISVAACIMFMCTRVHLRVDEYMWICLRVRPYFNVACANACHVCSYVCACKSCV